jgi:transposase
LHFSKDTLILADTGYLGIKKLHTNSQIPKKSSKKHQLTSDEKAYNFAISKRRIYIEHINRYIKRFKILSSRYRNKRRRFALRVSLICGIYNFQM